MLTNEDLPETFKNISFEYQEQEVIPVMLQVSNYSEVKQTLELFKDKQEFEIVFRYATVKYKNLMVKIIAVKNKESYRNFCAMQFGVLLLQRGTEEELKNLCRARLRCLPCKELEYE